MTGGLFVRAQETRMEQQIDTLLQMAQSRDASQFRPLLRGATGISATYDAIRAVGARLRGEKFQPEHAAVATPQWKRNPAARNDEDGKQD